MEKYVIILTAKRIICVQEIQSGPNRTGARVGSNRTLNLPSFRTGRAAGDELHDQDEDEGSADIINEGNSQSLSSLSKDLIFQRIGNSAYKYWNIHFDDILKLRLEMVAQRGLNPSTGEPLFTRLSKEEHQSFFSDPKSCRLQLLFNFKILFTQPADSASQEGFAVNDFRINSQDINVDQRDLSRLGSVCGEIYKRSRQQSM